MLRLPIPTIAPQPLRRLAVTALCVAAAAGASAQSTEHAPGRPYFGPMEKFSAPNGQAVYEQICQGCHMPGGKGAVGAGKYPALAGDANLVSKNYMVYTILNGRKAMPPFASALDDAQVAGVVNYVRSHFGNAWTDQATPADVKAARPPVTAAASEH